MASKSNVIETTSAMSAPKKQIHAALLPPLVNVSLACSPMLTFHATDQTNVARLTAVNPNAAPILHTSRLLDA